MLTYSLKDNILINVLIVRENKKGDIFVMVKNGNPQNNIKITVIGVGGGGNNAVRNMINEHVKGVKFVVANTDTQALNSIPTKNRIVIGNKLTRGLGAGANPKVGQRAAQMSSDSLKASIKGTSMLLITAGMGGGTGTGAAPIIAKIAHNMGILTIGIVTKPFTFEGTKRMVHAQEGIKQLKKYVDTLIVVKNNNLFKVIKRNTTIMKAFRVADNVLREGIQGISGILTTPGYVNVDFADITAIMKNQKTGLMGIGVASGANRIHQATENAINSPLLDTKITNAKQVLLNISGNSNLSLYEAQQASNMIQEATSQDINIIFGTTIDNSLKDKVRVTVIATGIHQPKHMLKPSKITMAKTNSQSSQPKANTITHNSASATTTFFTHHKSTAHESRLSQLHNKFMKKVHPSAPKFDFSFGK